MIRRPEEVPGMPRIVGTDEEITQFGGGEGARALSFPENTAPWGLGSFHSAAWDPLWSVPLVETAAGSSGAAVQRKRARLSP